VPPKKDEGLKKRVPSDINFDFPTRLELLRKSFDEYERRKRKLWGILNTPAMPDLPKTPVALDACDFYDAEIDPDDESEWCIDADELCRCRDCGGYYRFRDMVHGHNDTCRQLCRYSGERL